MGTECLAGEHDGSVQNLLLQRQQGCQYTAAPGAGQTDGPICRAGAARTEN